jgi:hypothetical protein
MVVARLGGRVVWGFAGTAELVCDSVVEESELDDREVVALVREGKENDTVELDEADVDVGQ